ncbi:hypothetical protein PMZ80_002947 [Knufia obscura]|uniref:PHD-type domain-containing protein n=2 Tax=Knufia TaxID=430999 RepID=A0AAN8EJT7_9EURO|nr:hypothetical protein PMZ80_002947 [Knufia obscura]KAK5952467.1 hypothetical protein OHC33_006510 [Knufia fluminis]
MDQQRRMSSQSQRPVMGPPETPSRGMIPQSPNIFTNIQFSPDMFSQQVMDPQSAPIYPQQRLFWDPPTATPLQSTPQQFHTPTAFPDDFSASFNSNSTIMPHDFGGTPQDMPYDLPTVSQSMSTSFMDGSVFPAPFQTSPRLAPPPPDNPTQFLSSPARRFGGEPKMDSLNARRTVPELPAYHHQLQESKREKEMLLARERRKSRTLKRSQDEDIVMKSVRRALSPRKSSRPGLNRSATFAGVQKVTAIDTISLDSGASSRSTRAGRSSPLRQIRDFTRRSSGSTTLSKSRSHVSLAIDDNGVARTIMNALPETDDQEMDDDNMTDQMTSEDENDHDMLYSFSGDPHSSNDSFMSRGDARDALRSSAHLSMGSDRIARVSMGGGPPVDPRLDIQDGTSTIRRARGETLMSTNTDATNGGNAQQALRLMMQDRSRSASSHASSSSMQFHSSPPMPHSHLPGFNNSPTTITDPDLDTPSTDAGSTSSGTRCVCNKTPPDATIMIQCCSCSKWLHAKCVGLNNRNIPDVYICTFCEQTPMRGGTIRPNMRQPSFGQSPLAHKSKRLR